MQYLKTAFTLLIPLLLSACLSGQTNSDKGNADFYFDQENASKSYRMDVYKNHSNLCKESTSPLLQLEQLTLRHFDVYNSADNYEPCMRRKTHTIIDITSNETNSNQPSFEMEWSFKNNEATYLNFEFQSIHNGKSIFLFNGNGVLIKENSFFENHFSACLWTHNLDIDCVIPRPDYNLPEFHGKANLSDIWKQQGDIISLNIQLCTKEPSNQNEMFTCKKKTMGHMRFL